LGPAEVATLAVTGTHGNCTIPAEANGIAANVTIVNPTAASFLTVFPADAARPQASNLNYVAKQNATPNQVTVGLSSTGSPTGAVKVYNDKGMVDVIIDIVGFYQPGGATTPPATAGNWGLINRNTIGSPSAELRSGPTFGPEGPPFGTGSLNLTVGSPDEKIAWGNEVDFFGNDFESLTALGFYVFNVGENLGTPAAPAPAPMPSIAIEVNPNLADVPGDNFSTLVWFPPVSAPGWSRFLDATTTGLWGATGLPAGHACDINGSLCTWTQLQTMLDDGGAPATIFTIAITKGRDQEWHGAVDGLTINNTVFDFEENGVFTHPAP
jgi:hypothetical protein